MNQEDVKLLGVPKSKYWKFILGFFAVIIGVFILYVIGFWAGKYYWMWKYFGY